MEPAALVKSPTRGGRAALRKCGRPKRQGVKTPCGKGAGWGTSHPGYGACKLHGGSSPSGIKAAAKEAARDFARGMLGAEMDVEPGEAMVQSVRLASGMVTYYQLQVLALGETDAPETLVSGLERAIERYARISKMALDAGVDERRMRAIEGLADRLVSAAEAGLAAMIAAGLVLTPEHRAAFAREYAQKLAALEPGHDVEGSAEDL